MKRRPTWSPMSSVPRTTASVALVLLLVVIVVVLPPGVTSTAIASPVSLTTSSSSKKQKQLVSKKGKSDNSIWLVRRKQQYQYRGGGFYDRVDDDEYDYDDEDSLQQSSSTGGLLSKMWPPWPISLLQKDRRSSSDSSGNNGNEKSLLEDSSMGALAWAYLRQRARIGVRQAQEASSQVWFHLPAASPPLLLFACVPRSKVVTIIQDGTSVEVTRRVFPVISNPFARFIVLSSLGLAVLSWSNQELGRKRKLTPLDDVFPSIGSSVSKVLLPPVLPCEVTEPEIEALQSAANQQSKIDGSSMAKNVSENSRDEDDDEDDEDDENANNVLSRVSPRIKKHLNEFYETASQPQRNIQYYFREWKRRRDVRKREVAKVNRMSTFDELVALQALKRKATAAATKRSNRNKWRGPTSSLQSQGIDEASKATTSWALVTGASGGIGRALAVELARWDIPVILVARDVSKLYRIAEDLQVCYGIKCCVLGADLSEPKAAERIYKTTKEAGIKVEILCNNAGVGSDGLSVDMATEDVENMVMLNCLNYAKLAQMYGHDMKQRRRGRILMVSSMAGLCSANPNVAVYGATKAFGKSLALAMAKELETYGVGVTCLLPGAVKTNFQESTPNALCWKIPFYARPADNVAHQGVTSLFDGDSQVIPGFQNRLFVNLIRPVIPQRFEIMCVQAAFSPFRFPSVFRRGKGIDDESQHDTTETQHPIVPQQSSSAKKQPSVTYLDLEPRFRVGPPPRVLKAPEPIKQEEASSLNEDDAEILVEEKALVESTVNSSKATSTVPSLPEKENRNLTLCPITPPVEDSSASKSDEQPIEKPSQTDQIDSASDERSISSSKEEKREADKTKAGTNEKREHDKTGLTSKSDPIVRGEKTVQKKQEPDNLQGSTVSMKGGDANKNYQSSKTLVDDNDDQILSPSLGPIDIMDNRAIF
eukprot:CAMPEP_0113463280 /NCGR_PEP_ID=MMETSP0014_2-20120614/12560_1 /TAXON_ID=2857 /ORGANISM="Nitzschia sp." /LENGTH=934 /DNA_ID=CAMNT_0000355237 /DNA_START=22 /DNA_END=2826 /DNA_ORIENTATION=- /assembly_acc=CAM_ASM_000159